MERTELSSAEWLNKAQAYCARAEHCAADVRRKLYEWGAPSDLSDEIEESLYSDGFLNDARFCSAYVHDKVAYQGWGRVKIQAGLRALQLPEPAIREAMEEIDEKQYKANLLKLVKQRRGDSEDKRMRFLAQRGFTFDEIRNISI